MFSELRERERERERALFDRSRATRFGEISPLWQNLIKVFGNFSGVNLVFGKIWDLFGHILYAIEQIFIERNGQILTNTVDIWSHCSRG